MGGIYSPPNRHKASLASKKEVNQALLVAFKIQEDVKMHIQLPEYDDLQGFDLENDKELAPVSKQIYG